MLADYALKNFGLSATQSFPLIIFSGLYDGQMNYQGPQSESQITFQQVTGVTIPLTPPPGLSNLTYYQGTSDDGSTIVALVVGTASDGTLKGQVATQTISPGPSSTTEPFYYNGAVNCYAQ
jgi:hypothetical protein